MELRWPFIAAAYSAPITLYLASLGEANSVFLAVYFGLVVGSILIPLRLSTGRTHPFLLGLGVGTGAAAMISMQMVLFYFLFRRAPETPIGMAFVLLSMIPLTAFPYRLAILGSFLGKNGLDGRSLFARPTIGGEHFVLEFSTQRWFRHPNFGLLVLGDLAMYFYGWSLFGLPLLLYSASLLVVACLALRRLAIHLLAPYSPFAVADTIDSIYPARKIGQVLVRPSGAALLLIIAMISVGAYTSMITNALSGINLLIFLMLIVAYAAALLLYIWKTGSRT